MLCQELRALFGKAKLSEQSGHVRFKRARGRVLLGRQCIELRLGKLPTRQKAVVPKVLRLQLATQPLTDERGDFIDELRGADLSEHLHDALFGQLAA